MTTKGIPEGYHSVTPYLLVRDAARAIEFYKTAFGAQELDRYDMGGRIGHAELQIGDSRVMLADEHPELGYIGPQTQGGTTVGLHLYVDDCDAVFRHAVDAGATVTREMADQFYGDRIGTLQDPFGHRWTVATRKETLSKEEIERRGAAAHGGA